MIIGITNPDPELTAFNKTNPKRSELSSNPFTYWERYLMIQQSLLLKGWNYSDFDIVPFPINFPDRIKYYIPQKAIHFTKIYEEWNYKKIELLKHEGYHVIVLFEGTMQDRKYIGTNIREMVSNKIMGWEKYLPLGTIKVLNENNLIEKLQI